MAIYYLLDDNNDFVVHIMEGNDSAIYVDAGIEFVLDDDDDNDEYDDEEDIPKLNTKPPEPVTNDDDYDCHKGYTVEPSVPFTYSPRYEYIDESATKSSITYELTLTAFVLN